MIETDELVERRFHFTDDAPFFVQTADGEVSLGAGWLAITEQEYERLTAGPIKMILHCPRCQLQHVDEPDERTPEWDNPPHRSHLCHGCGCIWRPADVPTEGVAAIETRGKADTALTSPAMSPTNGLREAARRRLLELEGATRAYANGYMLDEAADVDGNVCDEAQHEAAKRVCDALADLDQHHRATSPQDDTSGGGAGNA